MEKISEGRYKISGNNELNNEAKRILKKPLPQTFSEKTETFAETCSILNSIINDRNEKIDECVKDALKMINFEYYQGTFCSVILDTTTEKLIEDLFKREEDIYKTNQSTDLIYVKVLK